MNGAAAIVANLIGPVFLVAVVVLWLAGYKAKSGQGDRAVVDNEPAGTAYRIYATEFDVVCSGRDATAALRHDSFDFCKGWAGRQHTAWLEAKGRVECRLSDSKFQERVVAGFDTFNSSLPIDKEPSQIVLAFLIDQSGSMKGSRIENVTSALVAVVPLLVAKGIKVEVLGFSTAGWHGGRAYDKWLFGGQPKRPGRLCSLRHVIYKAADQDALEKLSWQNLIHPDLLRENVDGEAILWAAERLRRHRELRKLLVVISDGAPMDDATAMQNGLSYLSRHLGTTLAELVGEAEISLGAVSLDYEADPNYPVRVLVDDPEMIDAALMQVTAKLLVE